jgi:hypothetical protein
MVDSLVDATDTSGNLAQIEQDLAAAVLARPSEKPEVKKQEDKPVLDGDDIPTKLRGKSLTEVVGIYRDLESAYGRQANDLGTQRKLTDRLLDLKRETDLGNNSAPEKVQIKSDELLENPTAALEKYNAPRDAEQAQRLAALEAQLAAQTFIGRHPDYQSYVNNPEFTDWVKASPTRARAAAVAAGGDWSAAADLLDEYKAIKASNVKKDEAEETDDNLDDARKASLESSSQGTPGAKKGGKVYSRASLMKLRVEKPDAYYREDFQAEILQAYAEGRVK